MEPIIQKRKGLRDLGLISLLALTLSSVALMPGQDSAFANGLGSGTYLDGACNIDDSIPGNHLSLETAFVIDTIDKLWEVTDCSSSTATVYFKLTRDLDASSANFAATSSPIGYSPSGTSSFSGVLDGGGFQVSVSMSTALGVGLFSFLESAEIRDLTLSGSFATTTPGVSSAESAGALAVRSAGVVTISSVINNASVSGRRYVGGLVGYVGGPISVANSKNSGNISGAQTYQGVYAGGLVGRVTEDAVITNSSNTGSIQTAGEYSGGLVGSGDKKVTITKGMNSGSVTGVNYVGGLIGGTAGVSTVSESFNVGTISATTNQSGGLIGYSIANSYIYNSFNSGAISGYGDVAGLIGLVGHWGNGTGALTIENAYNYGPITSTWGGDPLTGRVRQSTNFTSVYATSDSRIVSSSAVTELQSASTYAGWDFDSIWGFGTCAENSGFPMLRFASGASTYYSDGCYAQPSPPPSSAEAAPPASYKGPMLFANQMPVLAGRPISLTGLKLESIESISIAGIQVEILSQTLEVLEILVPTGLTTAIYGLDLYSAYGKLTVIGALSVTALKELEQVKPEELTPISKPLIGKTWVVPGIKSGSNALSGQSKAWLRDKLFKSELTRVVCTGVISETMTMHQKIQVRKLAKLTCEQAAFNLSEPSVRHQTKLSKNSAYVRKVMLTFQG